MPVILSDINVALSVDELLNTIRKAPGTSSLIRDEAETASATASELCMPVAIYELMKVQKCESKSLLITSTENNKEHILNIGPHASLLKPARLVLVCVYSIGAKTDEFATRLSESGNYLESYLLDSAGVAILEKTGARVRKVAENEASEREWGVGASLSPGSLKGWPLSDQTEISRILDLSLIGVKINEAAVLVPYKSVSCIIGIGPGYTDKTVGPVCKHCSHADNCSHHSINSVM